MNEPDESGTFTLKIKSKSDEHEGTQKKTFTKWINSQLSKSGTDVKVVNLFDDLRDGIALLTLLETLSGKKIRRERGHMRVHHLNNVNNALTLLENYDIKLVNISNNDIVDGNPKITLGLLWNIISHFQLLNALQSLMADFQGTPEEALLRWCRQSTKDYDGINITNFTSSWKDGLGFNALIHRYRPDLLKYDHLVGKSASYNCENAFYIAQDKLGVVRLLDPEDVARDRPDKKSIMMYVATLYNKLSPNSTLGSLGQRNSNGIVSTRDPYQTSLSSSTSRSVQSTQVSSTVKRTVTSSYSSSSSVDEKRSKTMSSTTNGEPIKYTTSETSSFIREKPVQQTSTTVVEHVLQGRPDSFYNESDSIRNSVGSFRDSESNRDSGGDRDWEDYNVQLQEVLTWLTKAETKLRSQPVVSRNVDIVKEQFHEHEDFMMELTSHQTSVGGVLEYGNQLISEGLVSEKEENDIRDQMISLNERWESLRISAMERQTSLHENLMKLQQLQIDQLAEWLNKAETRIEKSNDVGSDLDTVRGKVDEHKIFQEDLENQQQKVNSLTHMVVVVDDSAGENATADLEEQLAQLGDRWSAVCRWTEQRWNMLQDILSNWQEYRDEERRLSKWLSEKENQVNDYKHVDLGDPDAIKYNLQKLVSLEHEMEAQQATFGTFNMAAERVAEHLDEDSPGVDAIQDRMEEFNDQWNKITTDVANRILLLKGLESKLQPFQSEIDEKSYWLNETEIALKSPKMNFDNDKQSSDELTRQYTVIESLESARNQRKPSVLAIQKKGDELKEQIRAQGTLPVSFEHNLKAFNERWETASKLIDEKKLKVTLARQRRDVVDMSARVENTLKETERFVDRLANVPNDEYEIKSQLDQCKSKLDDLFSNERHLIKLRDLAKNLSKEDRQTPIFQLSAKRLDDRWTSVASKIEDRKRQLNSTLESGPPKEYLTTMDTVLMSIKNAESSLGGEFLITEVSSLEDQIQRFKKIQLALQDQKKNIDYLNSTGDKFLKSLPRQKLEQLRSKLTDVNNKWKDVTMVIEKRQTQAQKGVNQNKQFAEELKGLNKWIAEVNDFLKDQEPAAGDPDTLEAQLDQSEALQSDITKLQRKLDSLNETGTYMLTKATPAYAQKLRSQQDDVTMRWDTLVRHAGRVKDNLLAALEKYQKLDHDMKEMSHWIIQTERSISDDDRDIASGEITKERMDHYKELQQDVSKRAPVVVRINTTANQLADRTKQGTAKPLVESLKKLNSDWSRLKNKVAQRQHEFKTTQSELEQFHFVLQRDNKLVYDIDKVAERSYDSLEGTENSLEEALRTLNRNLSLLKMSGPGSVIDIANQLINKKISVTIVRRQRDEFSEKLDAMKNRAERTKQVLEGELHKRQQMRRDFETIKVWITKIEVLITTRINKYEDIDEREIKALNEEFVLNETLLSSVEKACRDLSKGPNGSTYSSHLRELDQLKKKWVTIQTKFSELKDQPVKKLGTEFEALVGDVMSKLDKIHRAVKKVRLVSGNPRDIKGLKEQCMTYKDELVNLRKDVDHVKKVGYQIAERSGDDKRIGVERRIEEVHEEHKELVNKVNKKYEDFSEALTLAGRIENEMTKLEAWLEKTRKEAKRRVEAGFPEDVDEEVKWNKGTIKEVTGRLSEVQRLTEVGRELVDLSETGQLEPLEDRLTRLNNTWEDLSSLLEHRLTLLPKYKTQIKDFEKLVDQLNSWLDRMNKELNSIHTEQPEVALEKLELVQEEVQKHEPQFNLIRQHSNEYVSNGRHVMEPYRRLLDRRWEDLETKISELEDELDAVKKNKSRSRVETEVIVKERKMVNRGGVTEEHIRTEEHRGMESGLPMVEETITTRRMYSVNSSQDDDIDYRLETIITEVKTLEELLVDIERPKDRRTKSFEITDKIQQAELRLDTLQPRVESILKESKTVTSRDTPNSDKIRHSLLDLSGRWLKACDEVDRNKRAVKVVPNWYQFRSNLEEINTSLKKLDEDDKPERYVKDLSVEELEEQRNKYMVVVSDIETLDKEGIQIITPLEANRIKRRLREINSRYEQYKRPKDDAKSYRVVVHTGDVKDADTRARVSLVLYGDKGRSSPEIKLEKSETYVTPFRRDQLDIFNSGEFKNLGELSKVKIWHDHSGSKPAWNVKSIYLQDSKTGKVHFFDCNTWIGRDRPGESRDLKCSGFVMAGDGEDIFTRHRLANVKWQTTYSVSDRDAGSFGWSLVNDMSKLSDEVQQIETTLDSTELQGAEYEEFSNQEDKLKSIGDRLDSVETRAFDVFKRSETLTHEQCSNEKEYDAVKKTASKLRLDWNNVNKDYKARMVRWERALTVWRSFHCDLKDLTSWLNRVERILADTKMPNGDLNVDAAMSEQRSLEDGVSTHESTINSVNSMGEDIIRQSSPVEAKMLRDKLNSINRRWKVVVAEVDDRKNRFKEEEMQIQAFMEESGDLLQWMDETDAVLKVKDVSPSDENALRELLSKLKEAEREIEMKDDSVKSLKLTGEHLLTKTIFSKPNHDMVRTRLDLVLARWEILRMDGLTRRRSVENKLTRMTHFLSELEELSLWASTTRDLLETQANLKDAGNTEEIVIDSKTVQESLRARQQTRDNVNETMTVLRRDSKLESASVSKSIENKVKLLNEDWARIASQASSLFASRTQKGREDVVVMEINQQSSVDGWDSRASPWPKFDKAVSELHVWLEDVTDMMKAEKVVLSDSEEIFALAEKQKSVDEQLKSKQHLLEEIAEMGHSLSEEADNQEDKFIIVRKVSSLKEHWEKVQENSTVWRGQIDYLLEEWKRYVELREELVEWLRKAEIYLKKEENAYNFTVSDLDEQITKHKGFEEDLETWRGSITAVTTCGENLVQEFPTYEACALQHNMSELKERWENVRTKSDSRRDNLKDAFERMVRFHEEMINALTWLTTTESRVAEMDSSIDASSGEEREDVETLKYELKNLEEDINSQQEMFASLNENGQHMVAEMEPGDVLTAVQSKLDDMNDRWQSLNVRTMDMRDRLEETATEWRQLLMDLQEIIEWVNTADQDLASQQPIGGDLEAVQTQNETHQAFKGKMNVRRLVVDRVLDSGRRMMDEYHGERAAGEAEGSSRSRIAGNIDGQLKTVDEKWSKLCLRSDEWQKNVDENNRKFQLLQTQMEDVDIRLTEAEQARVTWTPIQELVIESLHEQMEELKVLQERIANLQQMFENMSSTEGELRRRGVNLSANLQNRIDQLYRRWKQLQIQMLQRQNALQDAYPEGDTSSLQALQASVDPPWERAVAVNKVPYYINHKTETTQWDHPKMTELYHQIAELNDIKYSAYRTAMKLRCIQKATRMDMVTLDNLDHAFDTHGLHRNNNNSLIGIREMVDTLATVYDSIEVGRENITTAICIDLTLNWLLNVYDSGRIGKIRLLSFKVGLVTMCRAHLDAKYNYLFRLVADNDGHMDHKQLGLLLHDSLQIPRQLGEIAAFGGSNIEPSVRSCFEKNGSTDRIDAPQFLHWLSAEPQSVVWLPTLHRLAASEAVKHRAKCNICKQYPIVGFRFRCLKCFNYDLCQSCFWSGRVSHVHRLTHPMHQYCLSTTSGEDVKDFLSMVRNKFKKRQYKKNPPKKLGYLPIQTVMEGGNLETPPNPALQQNVNSEVHNRLGMYAHRLAEAETNGVSPKQLDEEHQLIAQYCQSLKNETSEAPRSPTQIVLSLDADEKDDLEGEINKLEDENRALQEEYERLKQIRDEEHPSDGDSSPGSTSRDAELLTEAKLLRQHKGRLEARMQVLEDHNKQLEAQLQRLRQLLDQPSQDNRSPPAYSRGTTPASSASSLGDPPYTTGRSARSARPRALESDSESDPVAPLETKKTKDSVSDLFSTAQDVNKAVENLVQVMTDDETTQDKE